MINSRLKLRLHFKMLNIFVDAITVVQGTRKNDPETTKAEYIPFARIQQIFHTFEQ